MEEARELAVVMDYSVLIIRLVIGLVMFFNLFIILSMMIAAVIEQKEGTPVKIAIGQLSTDDFEKFRQEYDNLTFEGLSQRSSLDVKRINRYAENVQKFVEAYPVVVSEIQQLRASRKKKRSRPLVASGLFASVLCAGWLTYTFMSFVDLYSPAISSEAMRSPGNAFLKVEENLDQLDRAVTKLGDKSTPYGELQEISLEIPKAVSRLRISLNEEVEATQALREQLDTQSEELQLLIEEQDFKAAQTEEELAIFRRIAYKESREQTSKTFWIGVGLTILLQLILLIAHVPITGALQQTRIGHWFVPSWWTDTGEHEW